MPVKYLHSFDVFSFMRYVFVFMCWLRNVQLLDAALLTLSFQRLQSLWSHAAVAGFTGHFSADWQSNLAAFEEQIRH